MRGPTAEFWRGVAWLWLRANGWHIGHAWPDIRKAVIVAAPHTSNWDGLHMIAAAGWYRIKLRWMGKSSLVKGPFGWIVRWTGIVPVERSASHDVVSQMRVAFAGTNELFLAVAPEATRDPNPNWKSGLWHIARGADVPLLLAVLDYKTHQLRLIGPMATSDDYQADLEKIVAYYRDAEGLFPEKFKLPL